MKEYVCIEGFTSLKSAKKHMTFWPPLECKFEHCPRSGFRDDWVELNSVCSYRRVRPLS